MDNDPLSTIFLDINELGNGVIPESAAVTVVETDEYEEVFKSDYELRELLDKYAITLHDTKQLDDKKAVVLDMMGEGIPLQGNFSKLGLTKDLLAQWMTNDHRFGAHYRMFDLRIKAVTFRRTQLKNHLDNPHPTLKLGQVVLYDRDTANIVCSMVAEGDSLTKICKNLKISTFLIQSWRKRVPEFAEAYADAKTLSAEIRFDEALDIVDNATSDTASVAKLRSELRVKLAALLDKNTYGNSTRVEHSGSVDHIATLTDARKQVEDQRASIMKEIDGEQVEVIPANG